MRGSERRSPARSTMDFDKKHGVWRKQCPRKLGNSQLSLPAQAGATRFFGNPVDSYEDAINLQQSALSQATGWQKAAIFDSSLKEVKEKPKD